LILLLLATLTIKLIPQDVWQDCLDKSQGMWDGGKSKKWVLRLAHHCFLAFAPLLDQENGLPRT